MAQSNSSPADFVPVSIAVYELVRAVPDSTLAARAFYVLIDALTDLKRIDQEQYTCQWRAESALTALGLHTSGFDNIQAAIVGELRQYEHLLPEGLLDRSFDFDRMRTERERVVALRAMPYQEYLTTDDWSRTRGQALDRAGLRCQVCNALGDSRAPLDVHHRTYDNLGAEKPSDLTVLCRECHELFHRRLNHPPLKSMWGDDE